MGVPQHFDFCNKILATIKLLTWHFTLVKLVVMPLQGQKFTFYPHNHLSLLWLSLVSHQPQIHLKAIFYFKKLKWLLVEGRVVCVTFLQLWLCIKNHTQGRPEGTGGTRGFLGPQHCSGCFRTALPHHISRQQHRVSHRAVAYPLLQSTSEDQTKPSQALVALQRANRRHTSNQVGQRLLGTLDQEPSLSIYRVGTACQE